MFSRRQKLKKYKFKFLDSTKINTSHALLDRMLSYIQSTSARCWYASRALRSRRKGNMLIKCQVFTSFSSFMMALLKSFDAFQSSCSKCVCLNLLTQSQVLISMLAKNLLVFLWVSIRMLFPFFYLFKLCCQTHLNLLLANTFSPEGH